VAAHTAVVPGVKVQLKSVEAPAASVEDPPVQDVQPVPVTETLLIVDMVLFVSVTVIVTTVPAAIVVPGVTLLVVSVVAEEPLTVMVPPVVSFTEGTSLPMESLPCPVAVQIVVAVGLNEQLKSVDAPEASVVLPPVHGEHPVPVTDTFVSVESPVFVSVTVIITSVPDATAVPGKTALVVNIVEG
jgi:hypothetical protein